MPLYTVRHKTVGTAVISVPEGAEDQLEERVAALGPGWSLDKKTDPADVPAVGSPAQPASNKE